MGKIASYLKAKAKQYSEDRIRRQKIEQKAKELSRDAYNKSYTTARVARASQEGRAAGWKKKGGGGTLATLARYGESFSKAGEESFGLGFNSKKQDDPFDLGFGFSEKKRKRRKR